MGCSSALGSASHYTTPHCYLSHCHFAFVAVATLVTCAACLPLVAIHTFAVVRVYGCGAPRLPPLPHTYAVTWCHLRLPHSYRHLPPLDLVLVTACRVPHYTAHCRHMLHTCHACRSRYARLRSHAPLLLRGTALPALPAYLPLPQLYCYIRSLRYNVGCRTRALPVATGCTTGFYAFSAAWLPRACQYTVLPYFPKGHTLPTFCFIVPSLTPTHRFCNLPVPRLFTTYDSVVVVVDRGTCCREEDATTCGL